MLKETTEPQRPAAAAGTQTLAVDLLAPCFWPEVRRGTERFTRELADGLIARGHRPRLVTSHRGRPTRTVEDGLPIVRVPRPPDGRFRRRMYEDYVTHQPFFVAALHLGSAQLAHAMHAPDAVAALKWKARTGRPVVFSFMGVPDHDGMFARRRRLGYMLQALEGCDAVVALSRAARDAFHHWFGHEARLIEPGVNLEAFPLGAARAAKPTIICAADLSEPRKNVAHVIEAFRQVRRERPDVRLVLSRPRRPEDAVAIEGLAGVEIVDLDDRAALAAAYGEAWVSVLASHGEAFGLVLAEALSCGTPVVGSDNGGIPEIVDGRDGIGRIFPTGDVGALATALLEALELAEAPGTREACRARAVELSADRTTERYVELYRELL